MRSKTMTKLIFLTSAVALITTAAGAQHIITVPHDRPKTSSAVEDRSQQLHVKRSGTNERIDMYPGMIWRYEAPVAIKHVHIGDEDLVFVQPGETDRVIYIGVFNKSGGNIGGNDKAGNTTVVAQAGDGGNTATGGNDKQGGKTGGRTNVILLDGGDEPVANIEIDARQDYLRKDEGLITFVRNGGYTTYQCRDSNPFCLPVPMRFPQPN